MDKAGASSGLIPLYRHDYIPLMWVRAVLPQVNSLPGSQGATAVAYRYGQIHIGQDAAQVGGHVVWTLLSVCEHRVAIWGQAGHENFQVVPYGRVCIFAQD